MITQRAVVEVFALCVAIFAGFDFSVARTLARVWTLSVLSISQYGKGTTKTAPSPRTVISHLTSFS
jgi:hypothetical protein